ncbi:MAG: hypothetical protein ABFD92_07855 [Planctomycetaceae bacterium]|nr:hypothetical protein [Planctomycetaceae bacterium]
MGKITGADCKLYHNTGTHAVPVWDEVPNVKDLNLTLEKPEIDMSTRGNGGFKATGVGLKDATVEFEMLWDTADTDFTAFQTAWNAGTPIELAVMDGDITVPGHHGLWATMNVLKFSRKEPLEGPVAVDVSLKPAPAAVTPEWYVVPAPEPEE